MDLRKGRGSGRQVHWVQLDACSCHCCPLCRCVHGRTIIIIPELKSSQQRSAVLECRGPSCLATHPTYPNGTFGTSSWCQTKFLSRERDERIRGVQQAEKFGFRRSTYGSSGSQAERVGDEWRSASRKEVVVGPYGRASLESTGGRIRSGSSRWKEQCVTVAGSRFVPSSSRLLT